MTEQPGQTPPERLPAPRPEARPVPAGRPAAPEVVRTVGLTPERAAKVVRQSANARWVAFLAVTFVAIFVLVYYFYELGFPGVANSSRLEKELAVQQVTDVTRGYKLYEANCARCHGATGLGGIGPALNDQVKLLTHLNPTYLQNVLTVGGRYVCGNANSVMPIWAQQNGGPLNYREIEELIAFLRAPSTVEFTATDPDTGKEVTLTGWRDASFVLPAGATPFPACWTDAFKTAGPTPAPSGGTATAAPSGGTASPAPSGSTAPLVIELSAQNYAFDKSTIEVPANTPFTIRFTNNDAGIPHNVAIRKDTPSGADVWTGDPFSGVETRTYEVPALPPGTYGFLCTIHPTMTGTLVAK